MNIPKFPAQSRPFLWGAAAGAIALGVVGFSWGGWVTGAKAETLASGRADAAASLAALKVVSNWEQGDYVMKHGWATMPGDTAEPNFNVARACAAAIDKLAL